LRSSSTPYCPANTVALRANPTARRHNGTTMMVHQ
jgi:hypothetical protein